MILLSNLGNVLVFLGLPTKGTKQKKLRQHYITNILVYIGTHISLILWHFLVLLLLTFLHLCDLQLRWTTSLCLHHLDCSLEQDTCILNDGFLESCIVHTDLPNILYKNTHCRKFHKGVWLICCQNTPYSKPSYSPANWGNSQGKNLFTMRKNLTYPPPTLLPIAWNVINLTAWCNYRSNHMNNNTLKKQMRDWFILITEVTCWIALPLSFDHIIFS